MIEDILKEKKYMTAVENKIAEYMLKNKNDLRRQSAHYISSQLFINPSMITRFCQKIGFHGYKDFLEEYLKEVEYMQTHFQDLDPNYPFNNKDKNIVIANKIGTLYHEIINDTLELMEHDKLQNVINCLCKSEIIYVYSAGVQADIAQTFKDKLLKIGKNVVLENRMNELYYRASYCSLNCMFVIISYSGEIESELRGVMKLKERNIPILAITSYGKNTLSEKADFVLYVSTRERLKDNLGDFSMNLSTILILDILYVSIFNTDYSKNYHKRISSSKGFELYRKSNNPKIK
ncbi:MAG: MurR/RpiR family transcriptional regulator [Erysipelotrichaceae bacterium]|nr:MurR/RpiR family transcriptional regulator [Erysipelotrichaceae bacterium]